MWLIWGSTYLAIRVAVETMPPLLAAASRFLAAGVLAGTVVAVRRGPRAVVPARRELGGAALAGALLLGGGVSLVMVGERETPSNLAALVASGSACWIVLLRLALRERVPRGTLVGVPLGVAGIAVLAVVGRSGSGATTAGVALCVAGSWLWAIGSIVGRRAAMPPDLLVSTAWQNIAGGSTALAVGLLAGEGGDLHLGAISGRSALAWGFLVLAGLGAFAAYAWLLRNVSLSTAFTNQYVNPVVAVVLGSLVLGESIGAAMLVGAVLVVGAVSLIVRAEARAAAG